MQEMIIRSQAKHLVREAVIGRFEPHLYPMDIPYGNVNEVFLPVLIKNHWTLYVYDLHNKIIQLLDSWRVGGRPLINTKNWLRLSYSSLHTRRRFSYDLRTFNFLTLDVPPQPNE
ncbi:hypothetical protein AAG906_017888 [Vitis piasezkii]